MDSEATSDPRMPRIFLDASVILSGLMSDRGASHALLILAEIGLIRPVVCEYIFTEVERNVANKVPKFLPTFHRLMRELAWEVVENPSREDVVRWLDVILEKDAPVLAAAVNAAPHRLVTLDTRHFIDPPQVAQRSGLVICKPGDVLQEIRTLLAQGFTDSAEEST